MLQIKLPHSACQIEMIIIKVLNFIRFSLFNDTVSWKIEDKNDFVSSTLDIFITLICFVSTCDKRYYIVVLAKYENIVFVILPSFNASPGNSRSTIRGDQVYDITYI